jgi:hypothetical protein
MTLQALQAGFMASLHDAGRPLPPGLDARMAPGIAVYRNNYRNALMDAMRSTFERTRGWVGDAAFDAAAAHHLVLSPPSGWTLDDAGRGFARTAAKLFAHDPEVGDLAALEWAMHRAFAAADAAVLDVAAFQRASAGFDDDDWAAMRLVAQPVLRIVAVRTDCVALWQALADGTRPATPAPLARAHAAIVWREGWHPVCRLASDEEGDALRAIRDGVDYAGVCERLAARRGAEAAALEAGRMLAGWLHAGLLSGMAGAAR